MGDVMEGEDLVVISMRRDIAQSLIVQIAARMGDLPGGPCGHEERRNLQEAWRAISAAMDS